MAGRWICQGLVPNFSGDATIQSTEFNTFAFDMGYSATITRIQSETMKVEIVNEYTCELKQGLHVPVE